MKDIDEKIILINIIGTLESIQQGSITVDEGEAFLFSPRTVRILKEKKCKGSIINLIEQCCELEDIDSLLPDRLIDIIVELKTKSLKILSDYETIDDRIWLNHGSIME